MEQEKSFKILNILYDLCGKVDGYKIIECKDILAEVKDTSVNIGKLRDIINVLKEQGNIMLKYIDDEQVILMFESRGRRLVEDFRYQEKLKAQAEQERLEKERREREEAEHKARLEEERKKAALEIEKLIEETKLNMKKMSRSEKQEAEKTIEELESKPEYQEEIVKKNEDIVPVAEAEKIQIAENTVNVPSTIVYNNTLDNKIVRKIVRYAFYGSFFGGIFGAAVMYILSHFIF